MILNRVAVFAVCAVVVALNLAHPFLHAFEGGSLDSVLTYINAYTGLLMNERSAYE